MSEVEYESIDENASIRDEYSDMEDDELNPHPGFTDENASWLKPTNGSNISSSDTDIIDSETEDPLELSARILKEENEATKKDADMEMEASTMQRAMNILPNGDEPEIPDLNVVLQRIDDIVLVLSQFSKLREVGRSRCEYISQLAKDLALYYSYSPDLVNFFLEMFSPGEAVEFIVANDATRPLTIRINTLKARKKVVSQALLNRGVSFESIGKWSKVGLKIFDSQVPVGATPEYLGGYYMLQSASSFMPVLALDPKENEHILTMCTAPGGKAAYVSALMKNTGVIVANDISLERQKATAANFARLGVNNAIITSYTGVDLPKHFSKFNRILLDAPCSGLGVISRDPSIKLHKSREDVYKCSKLQKELILAAIDMLDDNGVLVYSTCSVAIEENELVVAYAMKKRNVKVVKSGLEFGVEGITKWKHYRFPEEVKECRRYYPHVHNMDGFFVARIQKCSNYKKRPRDESH